MAHYLLCVTPRAGGSQCRVEAVEHGIFLYGQKQSGVFLILITRDLREKPCPLTPPGTIRWFCAVCWKLYGSSAIGEFVKLHPRGRIEQFDGGANPILMRSWFGGRGGLLHTASGRKEGSRNGGQGHVRNLVASGDGGRLPHFVKYFGQVMRMRV